MKPKTLKMTAREAARKKLKMTLREARRFMPVAISETPGRTFTIFCPRTKTSMEMHYEDLPILIGALLNLRRRLGATVAPKAARPAPQTLGVGVGKGGAG